MSITPLKGEKLVKDLKHKQLINYVDEEIGVDQLSREVHKKEERFKIKEIIVQKSGATKLDEDKHILFLSDKSLVKLNSSFSVLYSKSKSRIIRH